MNKYLVQGNELIGPMPEQISDRDFIGDIEGYYTAVREYNNQLNSLPRYPISGVNPWNDGDVIGEIEVNIEEQFWEGSSWWPTFHLVDKKVKPGTKTRIVAIPVKRKSIGLAEMEKMCADVLTDEQVSEYLKRHPELVKGKEDLNPLWELWKKDKIPDLTGANREQKAGLVNGLIELMAKETLKLFMSLGLKSHIESKVINDSTGEIFNFSFTKAGYAAAQQSGDGWVKEKPVYFEGECILLTMYFYEVASSFTAYEILRSEGFDEYENPCWYWGIFQDGDEWGDYADLKADLYKIVSLPQPPSNL